MRRRLRRRGWQRRGASCLPRPREHPWGREAGGEPSWGQTRRQLRRLRRWQWQPWWPWACGCAAMTSSCLRPRQQQQLHRRHSRHCQAPRPHPCEPYGLEACEPWTSLRQQGPQLHRLPLRHQKRQQQPPWPPAASPSWRQPSPCERPPLPRGWPRAPLGAWLPLH